MDRNHVRCALWGGLLSGWLSSLYLVNLANCVCGLWVWLGVALAFWLYRKHTNLAIPPGHGARIGLMVGLTAAVAAIALTSLYELTGITRFRARAHETISALDTETYLRSQPEDIRDTARKLLEAYKSKPSATLWTYIPFLLGLYAIAAGLVGLLSGALLSALYANEGLPPPEPAALS